MKKRILATIICVCVVMSTIGVPIAQANWTGVDKEVVVTRWVNTSTIALVNTCSFYIVKCCKPLTIVITS